MDLRAGRPATGLSSVDGELLAGIVFGPAILGVLQPAAEFDVLAELGVFKEDLLLLGVLVGVAFVSKIAGSWLFALPTELNSREGFVVGLGMNGRGAVEIVIASIGLSAGVIDDGLFSILVFIAIFTTALVPPTMKWGVAWLDSVGELVRLDAPADMLH